MKLRAILAENKYDQIILIFISLCVLSVPISIAISQSFLALAFLAWLLQILRERKLRLSMPPMMLPIFAYMLTTTISIAFSFDFLFSLGATKKFVLFFIILVVYNKFKTYQQVDLLYKALFVIAAVTSLYAISQYSAVDPLHRIKGFMGHWMTFSGLQMLLFTALLAFVASSYKEAVWTIPVFILVALSIVLSLTRSVWLGALSSCLAVLILRRSWFVVLVPLIVILILMLSPVKVVERAKSIYNLQERSNRGRISTLTVTKNMVKANPLVGVGPNLVPRFVYQYGADPNAPPGTYIHLHNNVFQLAAERGLLGLLAWLWIILKLFYDYYRMADRRFMSEKKSYPLVAAIAALVAILVAGLFEYNFGDSEIVMLLYFIITAPYVVQRERSIAKQI